MIKKLLVTSFIGFLFACSPAERPVSEPVESKSAGSGAEDQVNSPDGYNEYLWCQNGPNYTDENYANMMSDWTETVVGLGFPELSYAVANPAGWSSNEFDHVAVLRWPNKETRDSGWTAYVAAGAQSELDANHPGVTACGGEGNQEHLWGFNRYDGRTASVAWDQDKHPQARVGYTFCSYNENKEAADLLEVVRGPFSEYLDDYEKQNGPSSYSFSYLSPDFEPASAERSEGVPQDYDFVWLSFYGDPSEQSTGDAAWQANGESVQGAFDSVVTCNEEQLHDLKQIKGAGA